MQATFKICLALTLAMPIPSTIAESNISDTNKYAWDENIGWTNWRDANDSADGVRVALEHMSGFIWGENVGWINVGLGDGPYGNGVDPHFGINLLPNGDLDGFAWGENTGWINFGWGASTENVQRARFDPALRRFFGWVWGENVGWINLDHTEHYVALRECNIDPPAAPLLESHALNEKNRYLSIVPGNPGAQTALRVTLTNSQTHPNAIGATWWVGQPQEICENSGQGLAVAPADCGPAPGIPKKTTWLSTLVCNPVCQDWTANLDAAGRPLDVLHIVDEHVATGSTYEVEVVDCACDLDDPWSYSTAFPVLTSAWANVTASPPGACPRTPPDGLPVDLILDCVGILNKFSNAHCAMVKARADIDPQDPNMIVDITDVTQCVRAFSGDPYPFPTPIGCP